MCRSEGMEGRGTFAREFCLVVRSFSETLAGRLLARLIYLRY